MVYAHDVIPPYRLWRIQRVNAHTRKLYSRSDGHRGPRDRSMSSGEACARYGSVGFPFLKSLIAKDLRNSPLDQINASFWKARLVGSHPQQVQAVGMPGVQCQDMPIHLRRLAQSSGLMISERFS